MNDLSRRTVLGMSVGALSVLHRTAAAAPAQTVCISSYLPPFLPVRLTVDCASRRNFQLFRKNTAYLGLVGTVNMSSARGQQGSYEAGSLFLFPWLKPKGQGLASRWPAFVPIDTTKVLSAAPIPNAALPVDEYFCNFVLKAPATLFVGFQVDVPYSRVEGRFDWFTNVDKLADGQGVGIDWTSSNLNQGWFGGSRSIPKSDQCNGNVWRKLIVDGLNQASAGATC
jgi:hypothetical protein